MITSSHNPKLQRIRALLARKKQRDEESAFVVEGVRLAEEGLKAGWLAELVLYSGLLSERGQAVVQGFREGGGDVWEVEPHLLEASAGTQTMQGLLAIFSQPKTRLPETPDFLLVADQLRDPGNLGSLLRTGAAAGVQVVLLSPGTTDAYNPKVVRAGMGAHFRLPILPLSWDEIRAVCQEKQLKVFLAEAAGGMDCWELDLRQRLALVIGSEAEGASPEARDMADQAIHIPMPGKSESLNASVAAGILLFEVVRQRQEKGTQGRTHGS